MSLQTTAGKRPLLAALFPPGNIAAEISALRSGLFRAPGCLLAVPFPCAAPLATLEEMPSVDELASMALTASRVYDRLAVACGFLFLAPPPETQAGPPSEITGEPAAPLPCGLGFPLARFARDEDPWPALGAVPPRLSFRTFQVAVLRMRCAEPWHSGCVWEILATLRYPPRILGKRSDVIMDE